MKIYINNKILKISYNIIIVLLLVLFIAIPIYNIWNRDIGSINIWEDESATFLSVKGISYPWCSWKNFSEMLATSDLKQHAGGLKGFYQATLNLLDPNGYSVYLRIYTIIFGNSIQALRSASFMYYMFSLVLIFSCVKYLTNNTILSIFTSSVPLTYSMFIHYSTEVRPYSMEMFSTFVIFFASCIFINNDCILKYKNCFIYGCVLLLCATSKYGAYVYILAAIISIYIFYWFSFKKLKYLIVCSLPVLLLFIFIYIIYLCHQGTSSAPAYADPYLLKNKNFNEVFLIFKENLYGVKYHEGDYTSPYWCGILIPIYCIFSIFVIWLNNCIKIIQLTKFILIFVIVSTIICIIGSLTGRLPWLMHARWSISYQVLSACSFMSILIISYEICKKYIKPLNSFLLIIIGFIIFQINYTYAYNVYRPYYETVGFNMNELAKITNAKNLRFYISLRNTATVRYLCEYGPLKNKFNYPTNFHFETGEEIASHSSIDMNLYDLIAMRHLDPKHGPEFDNYHAYFKRIINSKPKLLSFMTPSGFIINDK